jgi:uncharacterized membrane protein
VLTETFVGVAAVWGAHRIRKLDKQVNALERQVASLKKDSPAPLSSAPPTHTRVVSAAPNVSPPTAPAPSELKTPPVELVKVPTAPAQATVAPLTPVVSGKPSAWSQSVDSAFSFVKANPFASLGVLLLLVGVGFLFSLLAASNILPPAVRIAFISLAGLGAFAFGLKVEKRRQSFALNLQGGALAVEFLSILWAYQGYDLLSAGAAFAWLAGLSTAAVGWAAYTRRGLFAFMGILGALVTPIVASTGNGEFSGLALYTGWISLLGLGIAAFLRTPFIATTALSGVSLLLAGALNIDPGNRAISVVALLAMLLGCSNTALAWTRERFSWTARQMTSIICLLLAAPIVFVGFLGVQTGVSNEFCAGVLGIVAVTYLASLYRAPRAWMGWLLSIGAGFSLVAIGVGLEGPSRAMAFSATAFGLMLASRTTKYTWAGVGAFGYWLVAATTSIAALIGANVPFLGPHSPTPSANLPVILSAVAALGAGYIGRGSQLARAYTFLAVPLLALASLYRLDVANYVLTLWTIAWAAGAMFFGTRFDWRELRLSAAWVAPATLVLLLSSLEKDSASLIAREITLMSALGMSAWLVSRYREDDGLSVSRISSEAIATLSLLFPAIASVEIYNFVDAVTLPWGLFSSLVALLWAGWTFATVQVRAKWLVDLKPEDAGIIAIALTAVNLVFVDPTRMSQAALWAGIVLLLRSMCKCTGKTGGQFVRLVHALVGAAIICTVMQVIGGFYDYSHSSTFSLLFEQAMQPWVSLLWAAGGVAIVAFATKRKWRKEWMLGGAVLLGLLVKMMLVDLGTLALEGKVGVFLVTGAAFMALGRYSPAPPAKPEIAGSA